MGVLCLFEGDTISLGRYTVSQDIPFKRMFCQCDNYARGNLRCHLARGGTLFFAVQENIICSFFGHRNIEVTNKLCELVSTEISKALALGCRTFYFGGYGDFDELCYNIVTSIKKEKADLDIKRVYCVPRENDLRKSTLHHSDRYDQITYLMPVFAGWYKSIYFRNCAMIDESTVIIFYAEEREGSGAYKAYKYAKRKKGKQIVNLWGIC